MHFPGVFLGVVLAQIHEPAHPRQLSPLYEDNVLRVVKQHGASSPQVADAALVAAQFFHSTGQTSVARRYAEQSLAARESAAAHEWLATLAPENALTHLERAIALHSKPNAPRARLHTRLANWYEAHRAPKPALDEYRAAVGVWEALGAAETEGLAVALNDLGLSLESQTPPAFAEAERLYRRALAIQERKLGPRHAETGITLNNLAGALGARGRFAEAEPVLRRALAVLDAALGPESLKSANCASNLGDLLSARGVAKAEAQALYRRALQTFEAAGDAEAVTRLQALIEAR
ncbi:MAG: tetratricopeptide repeat protein [Acidobacteria bacterium]|nr:tetratricopeptide repeat protein [Acidobacteriota bacterium]